MTREEIRRIVEETFSRLAPGEARELPSQPGEDITEQDLRKVYLVDHPKDAKAFLAMKERTPARIGAGHAGARYKTQTLLRFQADHAAAQSSVFTDVPEEFLKRLKLPLYQTACESREEFLTRPDKGRIFPPETLKQIRSSIGPDVQVILYVADGLSSRAVEANAEDILPVIRKGLEGAGIRTNEPFFVRFGRVATEDQIGDGMNAQVVCVLLGERPGLVTAASMSAYIVYKPTVGMPESRRTVIANIHANGTPAVEAGAHIVDIIRLMMEKKASGIDLPL